MNIGLNDILVMKKAHPAEATVGWFFGPERISG